jgi:glycine oxidase
VTEIVVIGAGLIGMMCARELAQAGARVTLLERGEAGRESSWAGGGILSPLYPWRYPDAVSVLARWSQRAYPALIEALHAETGIDPERLDSGLLILDAQEQAAAQYWAARFEARLELCDGERVQELEPALGLAVREALWLPEVGQVRNPRLTQALRGAVLHAGVQLREHTAVQSLRITAARIQGVETAGGFVPAERVVVAGGAWTAGLLVDTGLALPVEPVRGQMLLFRAAPELLRHISLYQGRYVIPRRDGRVLVGSTLEWAGFDKSTTAAAREDLRQAALQLVPALADCPVEQHWAGLRPGSPSGIPWVGPHPHCAGLYLNVGHYRNGVVLGPASVRLLVDQLLERPSFTSPEPYLFENAMIKVREPNA